jgi:hypothetical protein
VREKWSKQSRRELKSKKRRKRKNEKLNRYLNWSVYFLISSFKF